LKKMEKTNANQFPKFYYAKHMHEGVCGYNAETIFINTDTIKKMMPSFDGKPIYVQHDERSQEERLATLAETAQGFVTETFYNEMDGWVWSKIMITDDAAHEAIEKGWAVSNAYIPTEFKGGGERFNVPYDREFTDGVFTHLAIVNNPRYEEAKIFTPDQFKAYQDGKRQQLNELKNSKPSEEKKGTFMKFFKNKKEEVSTVDADSLVELTNEKGETVEIPVQEMINAVLASQKKEQVVTVGDKEMPLSELVNSYQKLNAKAKKNADDEKKKDCENADEDDAETLEKENEDEDKKEESEKDNSKDKKDHFEEMKNATKTKVTPLAIQTTMSKVQRGASMYGSKR